MHLGVLKIRPPERMFSVTVVFVYQCVRSESRPFRQVLSVRKAPPDLFGSSFKLSRRTWHGSGHAANSLRCGGYRIIAMKSKTDARSTRAIQSKCVLMAISHTLLGTHGSASMNGGMLIAMQHALMNGPECVSGAARSTDSWEYFSVVRLLLVLVLVLLVLVLVLVQVLVLALVLASVLAPVLVLALVLVPVLVLV